MAWRKSKYKELAPHWQDYRAEYKTWQHMIDRCTKPKCEMYPHYGGRGVKVCDRWLDKDQGFINFYKDMGARPRDEKGRPFQIDRIDNDGDYCPGNCRWASIRTNSRNRSDTIKIYLWGDEYCLQDACSVLGLKRTTVSEAIRLRGLTPNEAIANAVEIKNRRAK